MSVKIITNFRTLIKLAREVADAKKSGDQQRIIEAERKHNAYREAVLRSDEMIID